MVNITRNGQTQFSMGMAMGGAKRIGYINGYIKEPSKEDPKYEDWESENMLVMNWILNSLEPLISKSCRCCKSAHELWTDIEAAYSHRNENKYAKIYQLTRELGQFKQRDKSLSDYYAILRGMWHELSLYQPLSPYCANEQEKLLRIQHIYDLFLSGGWG